MREGSLEQVSTSHAVLRQLPACGFAREALIYFCRLLSTCLVQPVPARMLCPSKDNWNKANRDYSVASAFCRICKRLASDEAHLVSAALWAWESTAWYRRGVGAGWGE